MSKVHAAIRAQTTTIITVTQHSMHFAVRCRRLIASTISDDLVASTAVAQHGRNKNRYIFYRKKLLRKLRRTMGRFWIYFTGNLSAY